MISQDRPKDDLHVQRTPHAPREEIRHAERDEYGSRQPNVLMIVIDSVRRASMSCYGCRHRTTPHIDALAAQGVLYEQAISTGCWTLPVHASLFTGLHAISHGLTVSRARLPGDCPTLALKLFEAGYQTACFSNNPYISELTGLTSGFQTVNDLWRTSHPRGTRRTRSSRLIESLERCGRWGRPAIQLVRAAQQVRSAVKSRHTVGDSGARQTNRAVETWLRETRRPDQPFFIFVNYMECHVPYRPPSPYDRRFLPAGVTPRRAAQIAGKLTAETPINGGPSGKDLAVLEALYHGELAYLDDEIGRLLQTLAADRLLDETVLILTSDHGDALGEHGQFGHRKALYEPLVRVPLIIRHPACFPPGTRLPQQVQLIDLHAMLLELTGLEVTPATQRACWKLPTRPDAPARPFAIAENTAPKSLNGVVARMIRTERYKFIWKSDAGHELYDLEHDPEEMVNRANDAAQVRRGLEDQLRAWQLSQECGWPEPERAEYDDVVGERLRDLGYVD